MNQTIKWIIGAIVIVVVVVVGYSILKGPSGPISTEPIKIGFIGALSGDATTYGEPARAGVEIAIDEINKAGGVKGRQLQVIFEDGKCSGKDAASAAQKLVSVDAVKYIIGGSCSGETLAFVPITEKAKALVITPSATSPDISNAGDFIFRTVPSDALTGKFLASIVVKKYKKVAIITENTAYATALRQVFQDEFKKLGGTIVADEIFPPETYDFRSNLGKIKIAKPEAIFINTQADKKAGAVVKQTRELDIKVQLYDAYWTGQDFLNAAGTAGEGIITVDAPGLNLNNPKAAAVLNTYKARYNREPALVYYLGSGYDAVYVFVEAMTRVGLDTEVMKNYLKSDLKEFSGAVGTYHFDEHGDVIGISPVLKTVSSGKFVEYTE